ncbi:MAG: hypothetical protein MJZ37_07990 [Bacilli bacterium]|nr:hypothetical protein [Bacilli bacterium]
MQKQYEFKSYTNEELANHLMDISAYSDNEAYREQYLAMSAEATDRFIDEYADKDHEVDFDDYE